MMPMPASGIRGNGCGDDDVIASAFLVKDCARDLSQIVDAYPSTTTTEIGHSGRQVAFDDRVRQVVHLAVNVHKGACLQQSIEVVGDPSPRLSQLDSQFIERGALFVRRLRRRPVIVLHPWTAHSDEMPAKTSARKARPDGMKLARHYQALLDSGKFESRAALACHLEVSRARVTQVLRRLNSIANIDQTCKAHAAQLRSFGQEHSLEKPSSANEAH